MSSVSDTRSAGNAPRRILTGLPSRSNLENTGKESASSPCTSWNMHHPSSCAMLPYETLLLARSGDLLSSKCRKSVFISAPSQPLTPSKPSHPQHKIDSSALEEIVESNATTTLGSEISLDALTLTTVDNQNGWCGDACSRRQGLLGGAEKSYNDGASEAKIETEESDLLLREEQHLSIFTEDLPPSPSTCIDASPTPIWNSDSNHPVSIPALPSFDYSQISNFLEAPITHNNNNSKPFISPPSPPSQPFVHGVPVFLRSLSQVRITRISANPLGGHALLISREGILFSYGNNDKGQLGTGSKSAYQSTPTIVTPLLENGGKAIDCAAGINHSLVTVKTDLLRGGRFWGRNKPPG